MDFSKLANFGRKVFNTIRDNVKVNVDLSVTTPYTKPMDFKITSDQLTARLADKVNGRESYNGSCRDIVDPIYFLSDKEARNIHETYLETKDKN